MTTPDALMLAEAYLHTGAVDDALAVLTDYLNTAKPTDAAHDAARRLRAGLRLRLGGTSDLKAALDDLRQMTAPNADDHALAAAAWEALGDFQRAIEATERARTLAPAQHFYTDALLRLYTAAGLLDDARDLLLTLPPHWRWQRWQGDLAADPDEAVEWYTRALQGFQAVFKRTDRIAAGDHADLLLRRAHCLRRLGRWAEARADYAAAAALMPNDQSIRFHLGWSLWRMGEASGLEVCQSAWNAATPAVRQALYAALRDDPVLAAALKI